MISTIRTEASEFSTMSMMAMEMDFDDYLDELNAADGDITNPAITLIDTQNHFSKLHIFRNDETGQIECMDWIDYSNKWVWAT